MSSVNSHFHFVNGKFCLDPKHVKAEDCFSGINMPGNLPNQLGSKFTPVKVEHVPGLTLLAYLLLKYTPYRLNSPHIHPRATEILVLLKGTLHVVLLKGMYPIDPNVLAKTFQLDKNVVIFSHGSGEVTIRTLFLTDSQS
ncbi:hypothetical protein V6N13_064063 [Hibiscus sabdariffa]|uniref:Cupin type-1 domain-containing protein n=1 Tax=Hibiscus sabdariffa TaxID=183260 RepID=A0ABR2R2S3_9ROSI